MLSSTMHKKWSFQISSVNVIKSTVSCRSSHINWRNPFMENFIFCASYWNSYCSMNSWKDFKVACGNRSGLNCKFYISRGVVAVSNSILHPRRHVLIRSYTERKLQQGVKNTSCLISYFFIFFFSLKTQKNYCHLLHNTPFLFSFICSQLLRPIRLIY